AILDAWRPRVEDAPLEHTRLLQLAQARGERSRRNALEGLLELVEADGARFGRRPEDCERPAPPEEVGRAGDLLGKRLAGTAAHRARRHAGSASAWARAQGRAPRRASSPDESAASDARPPGRRRGRNGSVPE